MILLIKLSIKLDIRLLNFPFLKIMYTRNESEYLGKIKKCYFIFLSLSFLFVIQFALSWKFSRLDL